MISLFHQMAKMAQNHYSGANKDLATELAQVHLRFFVSVQSDGEHQRLNVTLGPLHPRFTAVWKCLEDKEMPIYAWLTASDSLRLVIWLPAFRNAIQTFLSNRRTVMLLQHFSEVNCRAVGSIG